MPLQMTLYLTLILLLPFAGALFNILFGRLLPRRVSEWTACVVVCGSFAFAVAAFLQYTAPLKVVLGSWLTTFDLQAPVSLLLDPLSLVMILMITFVCALIHVYSVWYMAEDPGYVRYFALLNLFVFAMLLLVLAENLPLLYLGWEGVGFCSYALIGFWYREQRNASAGRKAFIVTRVGDVCLAVAVIWIFRLLSTVSISEINRLGTTVPPEFVTVLGLLLLAAATGKSAQAPLMVWLPDAMAGPTPVSAQIHAATMVTAGVYLLARMFPLVGGSAAFLTITAIVGAFTAFYAATCALAQRDLKRVLAYSTMSQIGFMMMAVGAGAPSAATFHLLVHAFFKALLFLGAGCVMVALHHEQDMFRMGGMRKDLPVTFWSFVSGAFCLAGFPLTGGFFSKDAVITAMWAHGGATRVLAGLALLTSLLTAVYTFRMVYLVFGGSSTSRVSAPRAMEILLIPLALLGLFGGLMDRPSPEAGWLSRFLAGPHEPASSAVALQMVSGVISLAGLLLAHYLYGIRRKSRHDEAAAPTAISRFFLNGWHVDSLYDVLFVRPFTAVSLLLRKADETVIDGMLDRLARFTGNTGKLIGAWACGKVSVYIASFAAGAALIVAYLALAVLR